MSHQTTAVPVWSSVSPVHGSITERTPRCGFYLLPLNSLLSRHLVQAIRLPLKKGIQSIFFIFILSRRERIAHVECSLRVQCKIMNCHVFFTNPSPCATLSKLSLNYVHNPALWAHMWISSLLWNSMFNKNQAVYSVESINSLIAHTVLYLWG